MDNPDNTSLADENSILLELCIARLLSKVMRWVMDVTIMGYHMLITDRDGGRNIVETLCHQQISKGGYEKASEGGQSKAATASPLRQSMIILSDQSLHCIVEESIIKSTSWDLCQSYFFNICTGTEIDLVFASNLRTSQLYYRILYHHKLILFCRSH